MWLFSFLGGFRLTLQLNFFYFFHGVDETLMINVLCGILSGVISSSIANPTDVLKVIMYL